MLTSEHEFGGLKRVVVASVYGREKSGNIPDPGCKSSLAPVDQSLNLETSFGCTYIGLHILHHRLTFPTNVL